MRSASLVISHAGEHTTLSPLRCLLGLGSPATWIPPHAPLRQMAPSSLLALTAYHMPCELA